MTTPEPPVRWREWPTLVVTGVVLLSLAVVAADHFRRGCALLSAAVVLAFFLRLMLPRDQAGMLAVRSKRVDLVVLGMLALATSVLSFWVPAPG
jgi:hypothetical protein